MGLSRYAPGIVPDITPPGISPAAEGERSPDYFPVPPFVSVVLFEKEFTAAIGRTLVLRRIPSYHPVRCVSIRHSPLGARTLGSN